LSGLSKKSAQVGTNAHKFERKSDMRSSSHKSAQVRTSPHKCAQSAQCWRGVQLNSLARTPSQKTLIRDTPIKIDAQSKLQDFWNGIRVPVISAFIFFYIYTTVLFLSPPSPLRKTLIAPFWDTLEYAGLWQYFTVFAPPRSYNLYLQAEAQLENGTTVFWQYPRIEQLDFLQKMPRERFRKLYNDIANEPSDGVLWPELARYMARQVYAQTGIKPVKIGLVRFWSDIPPPITDPLPKPSTTYRSHKYFTFPIQTEDLI
jgi:hypothetical protein